MYTAERSGKYFMLLCFWRWRLNRTYWMTRCVTSARGHAVVASLPHSSVPMSPVCSTTVSIAGPPYTLGPVVSSTSHWLRKAQIAQELCRSVGARRHPATSFKTQRTSWLLTVSSCMLYVSGVVTFIVLRWLCSFVCIFYTAMNFHLSVIAY